jgi:steroid 5-alpha reductase family enzyme
MSIDGGALLLCLAVSLGAALVVLLATFAVGVRTGLHRHVDTAWGLAFCAVAGTAYGLSAGHGNDGRRLLVLLLVVAWGLRLSAHIWLRGRGRGEDPRYARLLGRVPAERRSGYALRIVYLLQAGLVWLVSLPVQVAVFVPRPPGALAWTGTVLWSSGLFFEAVGDQQLRRFRADPANLGQVLDRGLWHCTRHPNYFGDFLVWWGLFLCAADTPVGWATVVSPLVMSCLLINGSGKPMLERQLRSTKPGYAAYVDRTSGFLPLPPRTGRSGIFGGSRKQPVRQER